jgi:hypothetical protein
MEKESRIGEGKDIGSGYRVIPSWVEIEAQLPKDIGTDKEKLIRGYYRMQKRIALGQLVRAKELGQLLDKIPCFEEFENENEKLFAAVDIAVRGKTNRRDDNNRPLEPLFRLKQP